MEGNKDDALKCLRIGKQAMEVGDRSRALKFISKARRLDPTLLVDDLLSEIEKESKALPGPPITAHQSHRNRPISHRSTTEVRLHRRPHRRGLVHERANRDCEAD